MVLHPAVKLCWAVCLAGVYRISCNTSVRLISHLLGGYIKPDILCVTDTRMLFPVDKTHHFFYSSTSGYLKNVNNLKVDERWRSELMNEQIKQIEGVMEKVEILRKAYLQNSSPDYVNPI